MFRILLTLLSLSLLATAGRAQEREGLKELCANLAKSVKATAEKLDQNKVRIGLFSYVGSDMQSGGAFMAEMEQCLRGAVNPDSNLELGGSYAFVEDEGKPGYKIISVEANLKNIKTGRNEKQFATFEGRIRNNSDIARITGAHVTFKPDSGYSEAPSMGRNKDIQNALPVSYGKPPAVPAKANGTIIKGSKYDVQILVGNDPNNPNEKFQPLPVNLNDRNFPGCPVVAIGKGQYYQVRVVNNDSVEIAVYMYMDGIDQFTFSENRKKDGRPDYDSWVVAPGKETIIKGWHKNVDPGEVYGFLTTQAGKGAASKFPTQSQGKVGTISISIAHSKAPGSKGTDNLETTLGVPVSVKQKAVERKVDDPHEFITVRYSR